VIKRGLTFIIVPKRSRKVKRGYYIGLEGVICSLKNIANITLICGCSDSQDSLTKPRWCHRLKFERVFTSFPLCPLVQKYIRIYGTWESFARMDSLYIREVDAHRTSDR
jgi:hypothetical protein